MADVLAILTVLLLFPLCLLYIAGCDSLKGSRR
jgi:hypothetical protein